VRSWVRCLLCMDVRLLSCVWYEKLFVRMMLFGVVFWMVGSSWVLVIVIDILWCLCSMF